MKAISYSVAIGICLVLLGFAGAIFGGYLEDVHRMHETAEALQMVSFLATVIGILGTAAVVRIVLEESK